MTAGKWEVRGYDTFEGEYYPLLSDNIFDTEAEAKEAAKRRLAHLEETQPSEDSGGQDDEYGIQDHVFIVRPDGSKYRYLSVD